MEPVNSPTPTKTKVTLTGAQETMLVTLSGKDYDARQPSPMLGDKWATHVLGLVDYDFQALGLHPTTASMLALRTRCIDRWTAEFLEANPEATVLHLACGLDARPLRLQEQWARPEAKVRWIDVDLPDVVELRKKLLPAPGGDYKLVSASVTDEEWLEAVPADRPTVVVMEGLTPYLPVEEGRALIQRLASRFKPHGGQLIFDSVGSIAVWAQYLAKPMRKTGATFRWAIDDPRELERLADGLKLTDDVLVCERLGTVALPFWSRIHMNLTAWTPFLRTMSRDLRYTF